MIETLPKALRPLVKRLEKQEDVSREKLEAIVFVVRLFDCLHSTFYATFLAQSFVEQLTSRLGIPELKLEMEVFKTRWSFRQGSVTVIHKISWDYDCSSMNEYCRIGLAVSKRRMTPAEGLRMIRQVESGEKYNSWDRFYRDFPGRALVLPFMAGTCSTVYFHGTWPDLYWSALTGLVCGILAWVCSLKAQLFNVMDVAVAAVIAIMTIMSKTVLPNATCFKSQVLGNLFWFYYGTAFVVAMYEIVNNQLITGIARFSLAVIRSYVLAIGVMIGIWMSAWSDDRWDLFFQPCSEVPNGQIPNDLYRLFLLFPVHALTCLMQFRVSQRHFVVCFMVQASTYWFQYTLEKVWKQPEFVSNMLPALLATVSAQVAISIAHRFKLSNLNVPQHAYRARLRSAADEEMSRCSFQGGGDSSTSQSRTFGSSLTRSFRNLNPSASFRRSFSKDPEQAVNGESLPYHQRGGGGGGGTLNSRKRNSSKLSALPEQRSFREERDDTPLEISLRMPAQSYRAMVKQGNEEEEMNTSRRSAGSGRRSLMRRSNSNRSIGSQSQKKKRKSRKNSSLSENNNNDSPPSEVSPGKPYRALVKQGDSDDDDLSTSRHRGRRSLLRRSASNRSFRRSKHKQQKQQIKYVREGYAKRDGIGATGYSSDDQMDFKKSDVWFCILPALYLLVPGSKAFQGAFVSIVDSLEGREVGHLSGQSSIYGFFNIALGQVIGLRLGFALLWLVDEGFSFVREKMRGSSFFSFCCSWSSANDSESFGTRSHFSKDPGVGDLVSSGFSMESFESKSMGSRSGDEEDPPDYLSTDSILTRSVDEFQESIASLESISLDENPSSDVERNVSTMNARMQHERGQRPRDEEQQQGGIPDDLRNASITILEEQQEEEQLSPSDGLGNASISILDIQQGSPPSDSMRNSSTKSISVLGEQNVSISVLGEQNASISVLGEQNASISVLGEQNASISVLGEQNASISVLGEQNASISVLGEPPAQGSPPPSDDLANASISVILGDQQQPSPPPSDKNSSISILDVQHAQDSTSPDDLRNASINILFVEENPQQLQEEVDSDNSVQEDGTNIPIVDDDEEEGMPENDSSESYHARSDPEVSSSMSFGTESNPDASTDHDASTLNDVSTYNDASTDNDSTFSLDTFADDIEDPPDEGAESFDAEEIIVFQEMEIFT